MTQAPIHIPAFVNYECQTCGWCCRQYEITFSSDEYRRLSKYDWHALEPSYTEKQWCAPWKNPRSTDSYRLLATPEGACVFLSRDDKCLIHPHVGELGKPLACSVYPFTFAHTPSGVYVGCRFGCRAVAYGLGESVSRRKDSLRKQLRLVEESGHLARYPDLVPFAGKQTLPWNDYIALEETLIRIILRDDLPIVRRLLTLHKFIEILSAVHLENVRGRKFKELVAILEQGLTGEAAREPLPETIGALYRSLFRLHCFIFQRKQGAGFRELHHLGRLKMRLANFKRSILFAFGFGRPHLPGFPAPFRLAHVARLKPHPLKPEDELAFSRYLAAKIFAKQHFGRLFNAYPLRSGLVFLLLSAGAVMWYARARALALGRKTTNHQDIIEAIRYVDYCYGSSPVPGLFIERLRTRILGNEDAAVRLALQQFT